MNNIVKIENNKNYGLVTTSRAVADGLNKEHSKVIRTLETLTLEKPDLGSLIIPTTYKVEGQKREYKEYLLTKDGFTLYMFNIQGYNDFKMAYIKRFNEMENIIKSKQIPKNRSKYEITNKTYQKIPVMREEFSSLFFVKKFKKLLDFCINIIYNIITVKEYLMSLNKRRENMNEEMSNFEIKVIIKMIIQILKDNNVDEKVIKKIEDLLVM